MLNPPLAIRQTVEMREDIASNSLQWLALLFAGVALAFALVASSGGDTFYIRLATEALIFAGLALSVDLLLGFTGMLSLGQALFFGLGAYTSGLVLKYVTSSFWLALCITLLASTIAGIVGGVISIRARGVYFALITFGLAHVISKVVYNTRELGASDGIIGIPVIKANFLLFRVDTGQPLSFFLLVLALMMGMYFGVAYLLRTPFGRTLVAIRTNECRVPFLGYNPQRYKFLAYLLAADIAAFSGALYPMLRGFVSPELMFFSVSGDAVITVIIGGLGTLIGPVYGSVILTGLKSVIGTYTGHYQIVIGVLFILSVIFFPKGIVGFLQPLLENRLSEKRRTRGQERSSHS